MKLRNKKTGGIFDVAFHSSYKDGKIIIGVEVDADPKYPKCNFSDYESLEEFCENWEDYKPSEPLIKDEKIRRAVRAWAEVNHYDKLWVYHDPSAISFYNEDDDDNEITFNTVEKFGLEHLKCYSIIELCGEEQECES